MNAIPKIASQPSNSRLSVALATTIEDVRASQALRYRVFAGELGAEVKGAEQNLDQDHFDDYCQHLLVKETATGRIIASTRLLLNGQAEKAGGFYSESEFHMDALHELPGRSVEVGRTCVDPNFRQGAAIAVLWSGLADYIKQFDIDHLFGCASIEMDDGGFLAQAIMNNVRQHDMADSQWRVQPKNPLPPLPEGVKDLVSAPLPPLLKAYFRLGAKACGEPCYDSNFNCADILVLVDIANLDASYARHFLDRVSKN
jgi:putative hemolysin